jgi:hypothetical protein
MSKISLFRGPSAEISSPPQKLFIPVRVIHQNPLGSEIASLFPKDEEEDEEVNGSLDERIPHKHKNEVLSIQLEKPANEVERYVTLVKYPHIL